jgi:hypothetical protein
MIRPVIVILVALAAGFAAFRLWGPPADPVRHQSNLLSIQQVRKLATLVAMEVPISDVQVSELEGIAGGAKLVLAVHGEVPFGVDLEQARLEAIDSETRRATIVLPRPAAGKPRLDHSRTRIVELQRNGLWQALPSGLPGSPEKTLANRAMAAAQRVLAEAATRPDLSAKACQHAESVLVNFLGATGWTIQVRWAE